MTEQNPAQHGEEQLEGMSRERLYELVWSVAASTLARWYGVSDNGLAKICRRMDVPRPPRGWWTKKEMRKEPPVPALPPRRVDVPATVRRGRALIEAVELVKPEVKKPNPVPDRIRNPHPIVAGWLAANVGKDGRQIEKLSEEAKRHHRICDALFKMLEAGGGKVLTVPGRFVFEAEGADIQFYIRKSRPGLRKQYAADPRGTDLLGSPLLTYVVMTHVSGLRELWPEGKRRQLEEITPDFARALLKAMLERKKDLQRREAERQAWEAKRRVEVERVQHIKQEEQRWRNFVGLAQQHEEAVQVRSFLRQLKSLEHQSNKIIGGRTLADWISWASRKVDEEDPLQEGIEAVFATVAV